MNNRFQSRGIILLFTLLITVTLSFILMGAVWRMQSSIFLTYRLSSEIKAYWSALAGLEFVQNKIMLDRNWAGVKPLNSASVVCGKYSVDINSDGYVKGLDSDADASFHLVFADPGAAEVSSSVPDANNAGLYYYSQNTIPYSIEQSASDDITDSKIYDDFSCDIGYGLSRSVKIPYMGVYLVSMGKAGAYKTTLEKIFTVSADVIEIVHLQAFLLLIISSFHLKTQSTLDRRKEAALQ